jgi:hypothetical protein
LDQLTPSPQGFNHPPDLTFAAIGVISNPDLYPSYPRRPDLKEVTKNFQLPSFETLGIAANQPSRLMSTHLFLQPLSGRSTDRTPSLSPDNPNPSTIHQYIITRTPPADSDLHPTFIESTDYAEQPSIAAPAVALADSSAASEKFPKPECDIESQWSNEVVPKISMCSPP